MSYTPKVGDRVVLRGKIVGSVEMGSATIAYKWIGGSDTVHVIASALDLDTEPLPLAVGQRVCFKSKDFCRGELVAIKGSIAFVDWDFEAYAVEPKLPIRLGLSHLDAI